MGDPAFAIHQGGTHGFAVRPRLAKVARRTQPEGPGHSESSTRVSMRRRSASQFTYSPQTGPLEILLASPEPNRRGFP